MVVHARTAILISEVGGKRQGDSVLQYKAPALVREAAGALHPTWRAIYMATIVRWANKTSKAEQKLYEDLQRQLKGAQEIQACIERQYEGVQKLLADMERVKGYISELSETSEPNIFDKWLPNDIAITAKFAREVKARYGVQIIVKPEIHTREPGRRKDAGYNRAFARIYITQECAPVEAFELYLTEEGIQVSNEDERATTWNNFDAAMRRRRRGAR